MVTPTDRPADLRQQPRRPDVCPLCGDCVTCGGERVVEGANANAGTWSPCPTCTGQQPAQPGSGEVMYSLVAEGREYAGHLVAEGICGHRIVSDLVSEVSRLQSALTEAQKDRNAQYDRAQTVSQHNSRLWSEREALRDQLTSAQQKIGYCMDLFDQHGGFDKAAPLEALVRSALSTIKRLKTERDDLQRRLEDGLDAWRKNNAHHAAEIDRLKREVERLSGEQEPPHCRSCRCGRGICGGSS